MRRRAPCSTVAVVLGLFVAVLINPGCVAGCGVPSPTDTDAGDGGDGGTGGDGGAGDGGDGGGGAEEVLIEACAGAPTTAPGSGTCTVEGDGAALLLVGDVLVPGKVFEGGSVLVDAAGVIQCVGCACADEAGTARRVFCPDAVISPGLINAHDHMGWMGDSPWVASDNDVDPALRWEHRHDWRKGQNGNPKISVGGSSSKAEKQWGELRFVLSGATSINGSGTAEGLLRNLDGNGGDVPGLGQPVVEYDTFPLGDSSGATRTDDCSYPGISTGSSRDAYTPHVSEGIGLDARNEFLCLTSTDRGGEEALGSNSAIIHGVGVLPVDVQRMAALGIKLIWSPRSNVSLYGDTAQVTLYDALGVEIALGTDWMPSGSMNMLRELRCAAELNEGSFGGYFSDQKLWRMATLGGAKAMAMDDAIGLLAVGRVADIAIFHNSGRRHYGAVVEAGVEDVALVLRGGEVLAGDADLVDSLESGCNVVGDVCGSEKRVCLQREIGMSFANLQSAVGDIYPLYACGVPEDEPTCVPARTLPEDTAALGSSAYQSLIEAEDVDGDGIANDEDNCDTIFNPIRPLDEGQQADADGDGTGDACDPCPLVEGFTCAGADPDDLDADGTNDTTDNCPGLANADQADSDGDGKGDACDPCPEASNPGTRGCPASVYAVKTDAELEGGRVSLQGLVVTAVIGNGFFAQLEPSHTAYLGPDHSGVFFYIGTTPTVSPGDVLDVSGATVSLFFDQVQLTGASFETVSTTTVPAPYALAAGEVAAAVAQGADSPLEGLLVELRDVTVTDAAPPPGPGDATGAGEFEVTGGVRIDDVSYLIDPAPSTGENFAYLRGPVAWRNGHLKLLPRSADDVASGDNEVASLGAGPFFLRIGATGAIGDALEVTLNRPADEATTVELLSGDDAIATVDGGAVEIAAGSERATVPLRGVAAGDTTLRARRLGSTVERSVEVRVLAADAAASLSSLSPSSSTMAVGGSQGFTVTLDIPAPVGGASITLSVTGGVGSIEVGGSAASTLIIAADEREGSFTLVASTSEATGTVSATLGAGSKSAEVTVVDFVPGLVINEVDYDNPGTDTAEFVEVYNGTGSPVSLAGYALLFFNGNDNKSYRKVALDSAGTLAAGGFVVVHNAGVTPAVGALSVTQDATGANLGNDLMQNGAPDGVALVNESEVVDAIAYEGAMAAADGGALGTIDLGDGTGLGDEPGQVGSLSRRIDGVNTGVLADDWAFTSTPTPGAPNQLQ